jgi:glycosyltransferase involved in cell wall biosynthesis
MVITIIIPCFNEERTIRECIENIYKFKLDAHDYEIILVDDASTDNSVNIIKELINEKKIFKFINKKHNEGKGAAINDALQFINGEITIIQDADLEYHPSEYFKLIQPIINHRADVVYGSRYMTTDATRVLLFWHGVANRILTLLSNMVTNLYLTDMETGYKVFKSIHLKNLKIEEKRFGFEPEVTIKLAKKKLFFYEVGIAYHGRGYAEGKKIGVKDAFRALYCLIKYTIKS